jgi:hypothetical protein
MWHAWGQESCIEGFGEKSWGKRTHERHRHRWDDNIKINIQEIEWGNGMD